MKVNLFGGQSVVVTKIQAREIKEEIKDGAEFIEIGDNWFRSSAVASVTPGGYTEVDVMHDGSHLASGQSSRTYQLEDGE